MKGQKDERMLELRIFNLEQSSILRFSSQSVSHGSKLREFGVLDL